MARLRRIFGTPGRGRVGPALAGLLLIQALFSSQLLLFVPSAFAGAGERFSPALLTSDSAGIYRCGRGGADPPSSVTPSWSRLTWRRGLNALMAPGILAGATPNFFQERCCCLSSILSFSFPGAVSPTPFL